MSATEEAPPFERVPVTVLTGFLGSGKTTLLNRILTEQHGQKIAVIENEFGEVGIDNELVIDAEEEIFEMNNGCICCTVRGDLIRILGQLLRRKDRFDHILIETTGLADPGPVIQTFFMDQEIADQLTLDGVVTVVDAKHIALHLGESPEAQEQIAFADVIVLNKTDLADTGDIDELEHRIRTLNGAATVHRTQHAQVPIEAVVGVGGFDLERGLQVEPNLLVPSYPFEWLGAYDLTPGTHTLTLSEAPDPTVDLLLVPLDATTDEAIDGQLRAATVAFSQTARHGGPLRPDTTLVAVDLDPAGVHVPVEVVAPGAYLLLAQHGAGELGLRLHAPDGAPTVATVERQIAPDHEHDDSVSSVGIQTPGDLHPERLQNWLSGLLQERGQDIFRSKGVLAIDGMDERYVFQGVHMLMTGAPGEPWEDGPRTNRLIFIGRNLDRHELQESFDACLA